MARLYVDYQTKGKLVVCKMYIFSMGPMPPAAENTSDVGHAFHTIHLQQNV